MAIDAEERKRLRREERNARDRLARAARDVPGLGEVVDLTKRSVSLADAEAIAAFLKEHDGEPGLDRARECVASLDAAREGLGLPPVSAGGDAGDGDVSRFRGDGDRGAAHRGAGGLGTAADDGAVVVSGKAGDAADDERAEGPVTGCDERPATAAEAKPADADDAASCEEPDADAGEPVAEPVEEKADETAPAEESEPELEPKPEAEPTPDPAATDEPKAEPATAPATEPDSEPEEKPADEPKPEPAPEPAAAPTPNPAPQPAGGVVTGEEVDRARRVASHWSGGGASPRVAVRGVEREVAEGMRSVADAVRSGEHVRVGRPRLVGGEWPKPTPRHDSDGRSGVRRAFDAVESAMKGLMDRLGGGR